jgi:alpha-L-fucosidase
MTSSTWLSRVVSGVAVASALVAGAALGQPPSPARGRSPAPTIPAPSSSPPAPTRAPIPASPASPGADAASPAAPPVDRLQWFKDAKLGIFIHWGVYSLIGRHEWARHRLQIPQAEYDKYAKRFDPVNFDADQWMAMFKNAGARYVVVTSKHHDGFSLYRSKVSDYDLEITPYKGDLLKDLADSARRAGMRLGFYHSVMDWHHPDYRPRRDWETPRPREGGNNLRYVAFMKDQLRELLTGYGDVALLWFDGEWEHTLAETRSEEDVHQLIRSLQPNTLVNDRLYERRPGNKADFGTPEQFVPATGLRDPAGKPIPWESCVTINRDSWGYNKYETEFKTPRELVRMLIEVASKGGNLLLNVGPMPDGRIQTEFMSRLTALGDWMQVNGEAIYGTTASPFTRLPFFGRATQKGDTLYLHVFAWPADGELRVPGLKNRILGARTVSKRESKLSWRRQGPDILVRLPAEPLHDAATVIALELEGPAAVEPSPIRPDGRGAITLGMESAEIESKLGQRAKKEEFLGRVFLTSWSRPEDVPTWSFHLPRGGRFQVAASYGAARGSAGKELVIAAGPGANFSEVRARVLDTGGDWVWKSHPVGTISLPAGDHTLRVRALDRAGLGTATLEKIVLTPAGK